MLSHFYQEKAGISMLTTCSTVLNRDSRQCNKKKKWKAYPFLLPKHRSSKTQKGTLCRSIPKGKV